MFNYSVVKRPVYQSDHRQVSACVYSAFLNIMHVRPNSSSKEMSVHKVSSVKPFPVKY